MTRAMSRATLLAAALFVLTTARGGATPDAACTELMEATAEGKVEQVKELLAAATADVNCKSEVGETPLHTAGIWGKLEVIPARTSSTAHAARALCLQRTWDAALGSFPDPAVSGATELQMSPVGCCEQVVQMLIAAGADVNAQVKQPPDSPAMQSLGA